LVACLLEGIPDGDADDAIVLGEEELHRAILAAGRGHGHRAVE
jgi:hypothetical protein